jgi:CD109 antigen
VANKTCSISFQTSSCHSRLFECNWWTYSRNQGKNLEQEYQKQLTYLRYDGSFSAFGKSDPAGSTWLTAFVTRAFIVAQRYIAIDENVINRSLKFLIDQQNDNGSFAEEGQVYDKSLQGGSGQNQYALTAFVLLAAENAGIELKKFNSGNETTFSVLQKGTECIINGTSEGQLKDPYANSLISYLLTLIKHPKSELYFNMTEDAATIDLKSNLKHWESLRSRKPEVHENTKLPIVYRQWEPRIQPASVETTSYALLSYLLRDKLSDSFAIARWLMKQRNPEGGFISTQDTVVGIKALANSIAKELRSGDERRCRVFERVSRA